MTEPAPYRSYAHFIGIDPGPIPGIVMLTPRAHRLEVDVIQCSAHIAPSVLWGILDANRSCLGKAPALVQIERFVVGRRAARSTSAQDGELTRTLIGKLTSEAENQPNVAVVLRSASEAKGWAIDARLERAGILEHVKGMRHARDAARHALFAAVKSGVVRDPLSLKGVDA